MSVDPAMSVRPKFDQLIELLDTLVDWQTFGTFLPGIERQDIEKIEADTSIKGIDKQKAALFSRWLRRHSDASWLNVFSALDKLEENSLVAEVRQKLNEMISSPTSDVQLQGIILILL